VVGQVGLQLGFLFRRQLTVELRVEHLFGTFAIHG
jgi:hypothetical protein